MHYVGIDVHGRSVAMCILDHHGKTVKETTVRGALKDLLEAVVTMNGADPKKSCGVLHRRNAE